MTRSILGPGSGVRAVVATVVAAICLSGVAVAGPPTGGALPPQLTQVVGVAGVGEVPIDAVGVALNVTVTNPAAAGFVTVHPCSATVPVASNVNYLRDQTVPNLVVSGLDVDGDVCIDTLAVTDLVVDVAGYIPAGSPVQPMAAPARFLDTREGIGAPKARVAAGQVLQVPVAGTPGVPANAGTVIFNTTIVSPTADGFATVFPCGQPIPATSTVNFVAGAIVPNLTITGVGAGGAVCVYSTAETDLVADVAAFVPAGATGITMLPSPQRILDTRIGLGGPDLPIGGAVRSLQVTGVVGVPASASAALVNLTATEGAGAGFAAAFPCGVGVPLVSNLNFAVGQNVANAAIVKLAADGTMCLNSNLSVDMVVDVTGYVSGTGAVVPITPSRLLDTREDVEPACGIGVQQGIDRSAFPYGQTHVAYDLAGGRRIELQGLPPVAFSKSFVMADCRIIVVGLSDSVSTRLWEFSPDGLLLSTRPVAGLTGGSDVVASGTELFALTTNNVVGVGIPSPLFTLPPLGIAVGGGSRWWRMLGASDDGTVLVFSALGPDTTLGLQYDLYFFAIDGTLLAVHPLPVGASPIDVSPDLAYAVSFLRENPAAEGHYRVTTLGGDIVASISEAAGYEPRGFATSGVLNMCRLLGTGTAARWDIFTPVRPLVTPLVPCLNDFR